MGGRDCYHEKMTHGKESDAATKADIQAVRTELKAEIQTVRTELKADIHTVRTELSAKIDSTKTELNAKIDKVVVEVIKTQAEVRDLRRTMATKDDVSIILAAIDSFAGKAKSYDQKSVSHGAILTDHEDKLRLHGRRLSSLESKPLGPG